jgi:ribosomal protein S18 acetylase RimI-like enzyme
VLGVIRRATVDDLPVVRELWEALYTECPEPEHRRKDWDAVADDVRHGIEEHVVLIAEDDGAPAGLLIAYPRKERVGYLSDLYVRPDRRGAGLARELLREAAGRLDGDVVELDVDASNTGARSFYERIGFREQSLRLAIPTERLA